MKKLKDLKEGDTIFVECPCNSDHWEKEIITKVVIGEDCYEGSGYWYMRIYTNNSISSCSDDMVTKEHKHWPILIKSLGERFDDLAEASTNLNLYVSTKR